MTLACFSVLPGFTTLMVCCGMPNRVTLLWVETFNIHTYVNTQIYIRIIVEVRKHAGPFVIVSTLEPNVTLKLVSVHTYIRMYWKLTKSATLH